MKGHSLGDAGHEVEDICFQLAPVVGVQSRVIYKVSGSQERTRLKGIPASV